MRSTLLILGMALVAGLTQGCTHQWFRQRPNPQNFAADVLEGVASSALVIPAAVSVPPDQLVSKVARALTSPPPPPTLPDGAVAETAKARNERAPETACPSVQPLMTDFHGRFRKRPTPGNLAADLLEGSWVIVSRAPLVVVTLTTVPLFALAEVLHSAPPDGSTRLEQVGGYSEPIWRQTPAERRRRASLSGY